MTSLGRTRVSTFSAILPLLALLGGCGGTAKEAQAKQGVPRFPVTAVAVQPRSVPICQQFIGATFALNKVQVNSRVNGYIDKWRFRPGDFVSEGQLLYVIDQRAYRPDVQHASGGLARSEAQLNFAREGVEVLRAESELAQAEASLIKAEHDVSRVRPLAAEKALPAQDLDAAPASARAAAMAERELALPAVLLSDGTVLERPELAQVAEKPGLVSIPSRGFYDVIVIAGRTGGLGVRPLLQHGGVDDRAGGARGGRRGWRG